MPRRSGPTRTTSRFGRSRGWPPPTASRLRSPTGSHASVGSAPAPRPWRSGSWRGASRCRRHPRSGGAAAPRRRPRGSSRQPGCGARRRRLPDVGRQDRPDRGRDARAADRPRPGGAGRDAGRPRRASGRDRARRCGVLGRAGDAARRRTRERLGRALRGRGGRPPARALPGRQGAAARGGPVRPAGGRTRRDDLWIWPDGHRLGAAGRGDLMRRRTSCPVPGCRGPAAPGCEQRRRRVLTRQTSRTKSNAARRPRPRWGAAGPVMQVTRAARSRECGRSRSG